MFDKFNNIRGFHRHLRVYFYGFIHPLVFLFSFLYRSCLIKEAVFTCLKDGLEIHAGLLKMQVEDVMNKHHRKTWVTSLPVHGSLCNSNTDNGDRKFFWVILIYTILFTYGRAPTRTEQSLIVHNWEFTSTSVNTLTTREFISTSGNTPTTREFISTSGNTLTTREFISTSVNTLTTREFISTSGNTLTTREFISTSGNTLTTREFISTLVLAH